MRLNHEEILNVNRPIMRKEIDSIIKNFPTQKSSRSDAFLGESDQTFKDLMPMLLKCFQKMKEEQTLPNLFSEANITLVPIYLMNIDLKILKKNLSKLNSTAC